MAAKDPSGAKVSKLDVERWLRMLKKLPNISRSSPITTESCDLYPNRRAGCPPANCISECN